MDNWIKLSDKAVTEKENLKKIIKEKKRLT